MLIAAVEIPKMFTAYAEDMRYLKNGLHKYQYFCNKCNQVFMAAWGRKPGTYPAVEFGSWFICPNCGEMHHDNVAYIGRGVNVPDKVRLTVNEFKTSITFGVSCQTVKFVGDMEVNTHRYKENFKFDIEKQTVTFTRISSFGSEKEVLELGDQFKLEVFDRSILFFFQSFSIANQKQKKELNHILKILREAVHKKLEKYLGYKVASMYVSPGQYHGLFLLPIFNMAFRVTCPDAPNLPIAYRDGTMEIEAFWNRNLITKYDFMKNIIEQTRKKTSFIKALLTAHRLPDKPLLRRLLFENPFGAKLIAKAFDLCDNYDCAIGLYKGLVKLNDTRDFKSIYSFIKAMKHIYGEPGIVRLLNEEKELNFWDCKRLYEQLTDENKELIKTEKVKLADLHDWMSIKHKMQNHKNMRFEVPEYIIKRLSMQQQRLAFFLPKESLELLIAGHELHNCVASYGQAMKDNTKWIVLVADDKGKLAACLEIKENAVVQAKLDRNKPVAQNAELNNAILEWAKGANIQINTSDIKVPSKNKVKVS
jgi:hypothetical protein